jgi:hypothetical protein
VTVATDKLLAGSYWTWEAQNAQSVPVSAGQIVAIAQTATWGPIRSVIALGSFDDYTQLFGSDDTPLRRGVFGAFKGEGRAGHGGAGRVLAYRMGTSSAAPAAHTFNNTTPATALTITALYSGTRGNDFRFTTQPGTAAGTTDFLVLDGALVVEKFTYASTDIASLAAQINAGSQWFSAVANITGVALASVTAVAATGGNDGDVLTTAEWLAGQNAFDSERWGIIATPGMTDSAIRAATVAWIQQRNTLGRRSRLVLGGALAETIATANTRSQAINDWNIVNVGGPTLHLDDLNVDASSADMSARVAGAIASRGESRDLIYARFAGVSVPIGVSLATLTDETSALAAGTTCFTQDTNTDAPIFIREGVTTYANDALSTVDADGVKTHPVKLYKRIKNIAIEHGIELEVQDWATSGDVLGEMPVDDKTRSLVIGFIRSIYQRREGAEIIQPGWTVVLDPTVPQSDDDDFVAYLHGFKPTRSLRLMLHRARVG